MKIKYRPCGQNVKNENFYEIFDASETPSRGFSYILGESRWYQAIEIFIINYDVNKGGHDNFFMVIEVPTEKQSWEFREILNSFFPMRKKQIKIYKIHKNDRNLLYIYEIKADVFFDTHSVSSRSIPFLYNELTLLISDSCLKNGFKCFKENTYNKIEKSSIVISDYAEHKIFSANTIKISNFNTFLFLMSKIIIKCSSEFENHLFKCKLMTESLHKKLTYVTNYDYYLILKFIFALYKIGLNNFDIPNHVKDIIFYYCSSYKSQYNKNWYVKCSNLKCIFHKNDEQCNDVVSPFNHIFKEINTYNHIQNEHYKYDYNKPMHITSFFSSYDSGVEDIMFLLLFFCTLSISNNKFSIIYNDKKYSNTPPILINTNIENIQQLCEPILRLIPDNVNNFEKNLKPQNVLNSIKEKGAVSLLDVEDCKRFNLIKLLTNYDENSKKCRQKITGVGHSSNSLSKPHHSFGIYGNNRLKSYLSNKRIVRNHFNKSYCFDLYIENTNLNYSFNKTPLKEFFEYTSKNINENDPFEIDLSHSNFDIENFVKETKIESLRNVQAYSNLIFSCIIFCSIFNSFCVKSKVSICERTIDEAMRLCFYIEKILLKSQKSFGSNSAVHKNTILRRLNRAQPAYSYLTERELYKFVNQAITNKDVAFAINELIYENILTEIIPLARGKRKGPKGRMFLVNNFE